MLTAFPTDEAVARLKEVLHNFDNTLVCDQKYLTSNTQPGIKVRDLGAFV